MKPLQNKITAREHSLLRREFQTLLCAAACSGVLCMLSVRTACAAPSVSDNAYSDTVVNSSAGDVLTDDGHVVNSTQAAAQKAEPIQSNDITGWPQGPTITAESAILLDAKTGAILYSKNIHEKMYPASTTKMLTCLIAAENLDASDTITFSESAIAAVPADGSNIGMSVGETITVEEALYGLMVGSANECANALAEKTAGSIDAFVSMMNEKASELGCTDSHFVNTNGLYDDNHYTSAHDLSMIARAFFDNKICRQVGNCASYHFQATDTQPDDFTLTNKHELINGQVPYSGIIGGKTGYTSQAHENLVTGCEHGDMELICVVMREDDPAQFEDTATLFDYGYENFSLQQAQQKEELPASDGISFLTEGQDLLGSSTPALSVSDGGYVILPSSASFSDLTSDCSSNVITYYYGGKESGTIVGTTTLVPASLSDHTDNSVAGEMIQRSEKQEKDRAPLRMLLSRYIVFGQNNTVYVNVSSVLLTVIAVSLLLSLFIHFSAVMHDARERARQRRRRARRAHVQRNDYYENHRYDRGDQYYDNRYDPGDVSYHDYK